MVLGEGGGGTAFLTPRVLTLSSVKIAKESSFCFCVVSRTKKRSLKDKSGPSKEMERGTGNRATILHCFARLPGFAVQAL